MASVVLTTSIKCCQMDPLNHTTFPCTENKEQHFDQIIQNWIKSPHFLAHLQASHHSICIL